MASTRGYSAWPERFLAILKRECHVVWCYHMVLFSFLVTFTPVIIVCRDLIHFCRWRFKGLISVSFNQERQLSGPCMSSGHDVRVVISYLLDLLQTWLSLLASFL